MLRSPRICLVVLTIYRSMLSHGVQHVHKSLSCVLVACVIVYCLYLRGFLSGTFNFEKCTPTVYEELSTVIPAHEPTLGFMLSLLGNIIVS